MSWESSRFYYEFVNRRVQEILGGSHSARCLMLSVDFAEIEEQTFDGKWDEMGKRMAVYARQLEAGGAELIILCTNTIHLVSDYIIEATKLPFLHIADATGSAIKSSQIGKVALLGTRFTMEKDFYTKKLTEEYDLEVCIPNASERQIINDIIYNELVRGQFKDYSREQIINIINRLQGEGAQGVIMGCTELPILIDSLDISIPSFDTSKIHAHKAVEMSLKGQKV